MPEPAPEEEADAPAEAPAEPTPAPDPGFRQPATPLAASSRPIARPSKPPRRQPGAAIWLGWAASLAIVLYAGYAATSHRGAVMRSWPPSIRLYGALGLTTSEAAAPGVIPSESRPEGTKPVETTPVGTTPVGTATKP